MDYVQSYCFTDQGKCFVNSLTKVDDQTLNSLNLNRSSKIPILLDLDSSILEIHNCFNSKTQNKLFRSVLLYFRLDPKVSI